MLRLPRVILFSGCLVCGVSISTPDKSRKGMKLLRSIQSDPPSKLIRSAGGTMHNSVVESPQEGAESILFHDGKIEPSFETVVDCLPDSLEFDIPRFHNRARGRSCKFSNMYRDQKGFMVFLVNGSLSHQKLIDHEGQYCVTPHARNPQVCPSVKIFDTYESLKSKVLKWKATVYYRFFPALTLYFEWGCPTCPGHSLWDDIYPAYVSLNKFGLENDTFLSYMEVQQSDCFWALYKGEEANHTNPASGEMIHIRISDRSKMEPYDLPHLNLTALSSMVWRSWASVQSFGWREARFIAVFNQSHSLIEVVCDQASLLVGDVQACRDYPPSEKTDLLPSEQDRPRLFLKVPSEWIKVKRERLQYPMEQVLADFGAKRQNAEALNHYELDHHIAGPYLLQFETIVMGSGDGNMILTPEVSIGGSRAPHWAMRKFRDRMLGVCGITRRSSVRVGDDTRVLFIVNKRFDDHDHQQINTAIALLKAEHGIQATSMYLDYRTEPSFCEQLSLVHASDLYVSGPGNGILNAPFLPDGGAVINLGSWTAINGSIIPLFMEQQTVGGGTPYLHVLFRDFSESTQAFYDRPKVAPNPPHDIFGAKLNFLDIVELVFKAKQRMLHGTVSIWEDRGNIEDNLSPEGVVFRNYCEKEPQVCHQALRARNFGPCQTVPEMWYELLVYEVGAPFDVCALNHTLISLLRQKHGLHQFGKAQAPLTEHSPAV